MRDHPQEEAKYEGSALSMTKDGKQMSDSWIEGSSRLETQLVKTWLMRFY